MYVGQSVCVGGVGGGVQSAANVCTCMYPPATYHNTTTHTRTQQRTRIHQQRHTHVYNNNKKHTTTTTTTHNNHTLQIILRDVQGASDEQVASALQGLSMFVNYFGLQRFGDRDLPTHRFVHCVLWVIPYWVILGGGLLGDVVGLMWCM